MWRSWWLAVLVACGGKEEEEATPGASLQEACVEQCDASARGDGCDEAAVKRECSNLCGFSVMFLSEDCYDAYEAVLVCQTGLDYACGNGVEINGVDWPVPVDTSACLEESQDYADCVGTTGWTTTTL